MWWMILVPSALAQAEPVGVPDLNAQLFRPSLDARHTLWSDDVRGGREGWSSRVLLHYADEPLSYHYDGGGSVPVLRGVATGDVMVGWGNERVRFGVDVPVVLSAEGTAAQGEFGFGDAVAHGRLTFAAPGDEGWGSGLAVRYGAPTATTDNPLGSPGGDLEASFVFESASVGPLHLVGNLGAGSAFGVELEGYQAFQLRARGGLVCVLSERAGAALEVETRQSLADASAFSTSVDTREALLSGYLGAGATTVRAGLGTSLWSRGIGSSDLRAVVGVSWGSVPPPPDTDGDGLPDPVDACRTEPEDVDGILDDDGCPDATPKVLLDVVDRSGQPVDGRISVLQGERQVGARAAGQRWELEPGAYQVVVMTDAGVRVEHDLEVLPTDTLRVVELPLEVVGSVTLTIVGGNGQPVTEARVFVQRELVGQGSPWSGELLVGERSVVVKAPGFRPTRTKVTVIQDGATNKTITLKPARATFAGDRITLSDKVYFTLGAATLEPRSHSLLDEVADVLLDRPEVKELRIQGHTDTQGAASANLALSQARADAVRAYLIEAGVEPERLVAEGFGETQPLDRSNTDEAHDKNRRVEFMVGKQLR